MGPCARGADGGRIRELIATVQDPHLRRLLGAPSARTREPWAGSASRRPPSTTTRPTAHGLLEHCLRVAQAVSAISATFPGIDRDIAVTGALLHDIGKLEAYRAPRRDRDVRLGRLHGEIALGYYRIRRRSRTRRLPARSSRSRCGHIILSHHGSLEHGSPVVPCTREATLVHMVDNLGGRLGSFDRLEKGLAPGALVAFDKGIGGGAYFAPPAARAPRRGRARPRADREAA